MNIIVSDFLAPVCLGGTITILIVWIFVGFNHLEIFPKDSNYPFANSPKTTAKKIYIYKLMDGNKAFYVGQTNNPDRRLSQHINDLSGTEKSWYIQNMNREPRMKIITSTWNSREAKRLENEYISKWGITNMKWS